MDIRSYFKPLSSKPGANRRSNFKNSSDEDVIAATPTKQEKVKKRKAIIISDSDSDDESKKDLKKSKSDKAANKKVLKQVNAVDLLGSEPVKQAEVKHTPKKNVLEDKTKSKGSKTITEIGIHDDKDFEKSLLELDEDLLLKNVDTLDATIESSLNNLKEQKEIEKSHEDSFTSDNNEKKKTPHKRTEHSPEAGSSKKKPKQDSANYDIDPDQERHEKRIQSAILYQKYLHRGGPAHHGSKELPKGKPNCLQNLCFLRTGVLDSLESNEFEQLVKDHGGRTVHAVSKKVNYVVVGEEPGPAKLEKARNYGIPTISEDELLDMIRVKSEMEPIYTKGSSDIINSMAETSKCNSSKEKKKENKEFVKKKNESPKESTEYHNNVRSPKGSAKLHNEKVRSPKKDRKSPKRDIKSPESDSGHKGTSNITNEEVVENRIGEINHEVKSETIKQAPDKNNNLPFTEKYKPQNVKSIIGQQGDNSNMKKLMNWLANWHKNHGGKNKPKLARPSPWSKSDNGAFFKAALLSGPPGVGKTTTATLVAKELGLDVVEFNASDTRNKKLLHEEVSQLLSTTSIAGYMKDGSKPTSRRILLMDEVDGMAGNEDRGGMQELISLIKNSSIPIICMCNDRNHQKVRSLANYCYDLRFQRPRLEQIRALLMTVCCRENLKVPPNALSEIITGTNMDIRQALNHLSMWAEGDKSLTAEMAKKEAEIAKKDTVLGPWEVCRKVFTKSEQQNMSIVDRGRLFFYDYSIGPLFIQENYLQVVPDAPKNQRILRVAKTADSISLGDVIDSKIRNSNNWSLLDFEAMLFTVLPGTYMSGHVGGQINFPNWLGKNSKRGKFQRIVTDIQAHMRTSTSASRLSVNLDYMSHLRNRILNPLLRHGTDGIQDALDIMHAYNLSRDDLDGIIEIASWKGDKDPSKLLDSKIKTAFTRTFNKNVLLPYALPTVAVKKRAAISAQDYLDGEESFLDDDEEENDDDDITKDPMIKVKKTHSKTEKAESSSSGTKAKGGRKGNSQNKKDSKAQKKGKK